MSLLKFICNEFAQDFTVLRASLQYFDKFNSFYPQNATNESLIIGSDAFLRLDQMFIDISTLLNENGIINQVCKKK